MFTGVLFVSIPTVPLHRKGVAYICHVVYTVRVGPQNILTATGIY